MTQELRPQCVMLTPILPYAEGSGIEQRAFHLLKDLASEYEVTLLVAMDRNELPSLDDAAVRGLAPLLQSFHSLPIVTPHGWPQRFGLLMPWLIAWLPHWAVGWPFLPDNAPRPALPSDIALLAVFRLRMTQVASTIAKTNYPRHRFLDMDDYESSTLASIGRQALLRGQLYLGLRSLSISVQHWFQQRVIFRSYDLVSVANPHDCSRLSVSGAGRSHALCIVRPNRVGLRPLHTHPIIRHRVFTLAFLGTLDYFPNEDAARWIARSLVPALRKAIPDGFRILIGGRGQNTRLSKTLYRVPEVLFQGEIEDLQSFYNQAHIVLSTVRCGGGTKVKLLEAVAYGRPVVATLHSISGSPFTPGEHVLCGTTATEIAACGAQLRSNPVAAEQMAAAAYARLAEAFSAPASRFGTSISNPSSR